ncbi:MAG: CoA-binding protein, partial [Candidatus Dormibacteraceae bacterium]
MARGALEGRPRRAVFLVNRRGGTILGEPVHPRLAACPTVPDLVGVCVPGPAVPGVVDEGLALGVGAFIVVATDVPDADGLARRVRQAGARLLGPGTLGLVDTWSRLHLAWARFRSGPLAIVTQSGQLGTEIANLASDLGVGVSRFWSLGLQLDVAAPEVLCSLAEDPGTRAVALYLETFTSGPDLLSALLERREADKPVLLLTAGDSEASARVARSHSG